MANKKWKVINGVIWKYQIMKAWKWKNNNGAQRRNNGERNNVKNNNNESEMKIVIMK